MTRTKRVQQRGSAMLVTMIVIAALLAGAAVLASMQVTSSRSTELTRHGLAALYCAEAGLTLARMAVPPNYGAWDAALTDNCSDDGDCFNVPAVEPSWLASLEHDIDGDGVADYKLWIRDNDDDTNYGNDTDEHVYMVARCTKYADSPRQVEELLHYKAAMNPYNCQAGGTNGGGNDNDNITDECDGL